MFISCKLRCLIKASWPERLTTLGVGISGGNAAYQLSRKKHEKFGSAGVMLQVIVY